MWPTPASLPPFRPPALPIQASLPADADIAAVRALGRLPGSALSSVGGHPDHNRSETGTETDPLHELLPGHEWEGAAFDDDVRAVRSLPLPPSSPDASSGAASPTPSQMWGEGQGGLEEDEDEPEMVRRLPSFARSEASGSAAPVQAALERVVAARTLQQGHSALASRVGSARGSRRSSGAGAAPPGAAPVAWQELELDLGAAAGGEFLSR